MSQRRFPVALALVLLPLTALADQKAADSCSTRLPKDSAAIYSGTVAQLKPASNIKDVVTSVTRSLVMAGSITRANARPAAEAAGSCLELIKK